LSLSVRPHAHWFLTRDPARTELPPLPRIFCFAHAGGNARTFLPWQPALEGLAEIVVVGIPGRGHRVDEPPPASVEEFADGAARAIAEAGDQPVFLYGHSLGALTAFEVAQRLRDLPGLRHLVASGCAAPALLPSQRVKDTARLEGREFAEAVGFFGGLPPEIIAAEELHDLLLPGLLADFRMVAGYTYQPREPLSVGLSLINGIDDPHVDSTSLQPWRRESVTEPAYHWAGGGHFFFEQRPESVTDVLRSVVTEQLRPAADRHVELI
jgi:surfactin synthase thioesterase subunit